jgi:hypothetical protein
MPNSTATLPLRSAMKRAADVRRRVKGTLGMENPRSLFMPLIPALTAKHGVKMFAESSLNPADRGMRQPTRCLSVNGV